jgi:tetratricopeptide (TPR) repeat protein
MEKTEPLTNQISYAPTDYERLVRFLISPGPTFGFAIARYADPRVRDRLIEQATRDAHAAGLRAETLNLSRTKLEGHPNLADLLEQRLRPRKAEEVIRAVFIVQLEKFLIDPFGEARVSPSISVLNQSRDLLPRRIGARVVLWLTDAAANTFATFAHDLYDVALTHFRFEDRDDPMPIMQYGKDIPQWLMAATDEDKPRLQREASLLETVFRSAASTPSKADAAFRIAQIHSVLSESSEAKKWFEVALELYREAKDSYNEGNVHLRFGDFLYSRGELDEAHEHFENAFSIYKYLNDETFIADSKGRIADILEIRGQFEEALAIRLNQQLPIYQKVGDVRSEVVTQGQIADILHEQGHLEEAFKIRQNYELPGYQKLGDIRSAAVSQGKIADILQEQGQFEEALEIRLSQQLPIYQKVGDTREEAITRGQIADIFHFQGKHNEAIEIQQKLVLPVLKKLGDKRSTLVGETNTARTMYERGRPEDKPEIASLLNSALQAAREMRIPEAERIENTMRAIGLIPESP